MFKTLAGVNYGFKPYLDVLFFITFGVALIKLLNGDVDIFQKLLLRFLTAPKLLHPSLLV